MSVHNISYHYLLSVLFIILHMLLNYVYLPLYSIISLLVLHLAPLFQDMFHLGYNFIMQLSYILSLGYMLMYYYFIHFSLHSILLSEHYNSYYSVHNTLYLRSQLDLFHLHYMHSHYVFMPLYSIISS